MTRFRIATWNIRKCIGLDRRRDPHRTARVIRALDAEIVALQEADKRLGVRPAALTHDVVERETGLTPVDAGGHESSIGFHGNAILAAPGIETDDVHMVHLPGIEPRGALIADLVRTGSPFRVVAVHLGFIRRFRRVQLATIRARLEALPALPTIVLGDFNEWSHDHGLEPLIGFQIHTPGLTFHTRQPVAPLDRVAVKGATFDGGEVWEKGDARRASDHLPVRGAVTL